MPREPHSPKFLAIRDALLALEDADRKPIGRLLGTMTEPEAPLSSATVAFLRAMLALSDADLGRFGKWVNTYLSKFGQVPNASSFRVQSGARRDLPPPDSREGSPESVDDEPL